MTTAEQTFTTVLTRTYMKEHFERLKLIPDWEVVMRVHDPVAPAHSTGERQGLKPSQTRPRRVSLHTLAAVTGRDPRVIAQEMQQSKKVHGYRCPDVCTLIFYLDDLKHIMIHTADPNVWGRVDDILKEYPFPKVQGFRRFAPYIWVDKDDNEVPQGTPGARTKRDSGLPYPYSPDEIVYAKRVFDALTNAGYTPGFKLPEVKNHFHLDIPIPGAWY